MGTTHPVRVVYCEGNVDGTIGGSYYSLLYLVKGLDRSRYVPLVVFHTANRLQARFHDAGVETLVSTRLDPGVDPIVEADRQGAIMAIVRLGNIDLQAAGMPLGAPFGVQPASFMQDIGGDPAAAAERSDPAGIARLPEAADSQLAAGVQGVGRRTARHDDRRRHGPSQDDLDDARTGRAADELRTARPRRRRVRRARTALVRPARAR